MVGQKYMRLNVLRYVNRLGMLGEPIGSGMEQLSQTQRSENSRGPGVSTLNGQGHPGRSEPWADLACTTHSAPPTKKATEGRF